MSHFGNHLRQERLRQGITLNDMARRLGYANLSKGCRRIQNVEEGGPAKPEDLPSRLVEILGIDEATVRRLLRADWDEWQAWLNEPVPMTMTARLMPAVYMNHPLPPNATTAEEAGLYARRWAKEHRLKVCLALSRRVSIWIDEEGYIINRTEAQPGLPNMPYMQIGGKRFLLDFGPP